MKFCTSVVSTLLIKSFSSNRENLTSSWQRKFDSKEFKIEFISYLLSDCFVFMLNWDTLGAVDERCFLSSHRSTRDVTDLVSNRHQVVDRTLQLILVLHYLKLLLYKFFYSVSKLTKYSQKTESQNLSGNSIYPKIVNIFRLNINYVIKPVCWFVI